MLMGVNLIHACTTCVGGEIWSSPHERICCTVVFYTYLCDRKNYIFVRVLRTECRYYMSIYNPMNYHDDSMDEYKLQPKLAHKTHIIHLTTL